MSLRRTLQDRDLDFIWRAWLLGMWGNRSIALVSYLGPVSCRLLFTAMCCNRALSSLGRSAWLDSEPRLSVEFFVAIRVDAELVLPLMPVQQNFAAGYLTVELMFKRKSKRAFRLARQTLRKRQGFMSTIENTQLYKKLSGLLRRANRRVQHLRRTHSSYCTYSSYPELPLFAKVFDVRWYAIRPGHVARLALLREKEWYYSVGCKYSIDMSFEDVREASDYCPESWIGHPCRQQCHLNLAHSSVEPQTIRLRLEFFLPGAHSWALKEVYFEKYVSALTWHDLT